MSQADKHTALLLILDGWGYGKETDHNAIYMADTPNWDALWSSNAHTLIHTSGLAVGLPDGQMGNSEVGHMNLGAGRVVYQSLTRIDKAIADGDFFSNRVLTDAVDQAVNTGKAVHLLGLLSPGGIHSHEEQIMAMIDLAVKRGADRIYLHGFLDGRDTPPRSALKSLQKAEEKLASIGNSRIASITGRFYAMDRDNRWDRTQLAYDLLSAGTAPFTYPDATSALAAAYARDEGDEFVQPTLIADTQMPAVKFEDGDCVVYMNFRADRARSLGRAFVNDDFNGFKRKQRPRLGAFVTLTEYASDLGCPCAFPPQKLKNVLGEYLSSLGKTQLRIAETEKYAHVTFFFNGGEEEPFELEERILVPSPKVKTYDLQPEMSAFEVTEKLVAAIRSRRFDAIICNYANGDMVGHTGNFNASLQAVETVDKCLGEIVCAIREIEGELLITADHGNVEQMVDNSTGQPLTSHTNGPVPLVYVGTSDLGFKTEGSLSDIAPTLLTLMGIPLPPEMTGRPLLGTTTGENEDETLTVAR
ncbi:MAG: 2,3-bisphosphoglycerate-independent phosphoglycerate mutase [Gammaproteobacteria bacterium]|nr:2,3-bisphosphoglycerate-independent phosphoglycerate mutase [Gammaproteobacteria bacterium]